MQESVVAPPTWSMEFGSPIRRIELPAVGVVTCGRDAQATIPIDDSSCSRQQFRLLFEQGHCFLEPLSTVSPTVVNGMVVTSRREVMTTSVIRVGAMELKLIAPFRGPGLRDVQTVVGAAPARTLTLPPVTLGELSILGRDATAAQVCLPSLQISRRHAEVRRQGHHLLLRDLGSTNGTFINGTRIGGTVRLKPGDVIGLGPYTLMFDGSRLLPESRDRNIRLELHGVTCVVPNAHAPGTRTLLDQLALVVDPGEFLAIIGPSGSGKSTLLNVMTARRPQTSGTVRLNRLELPRHFEELKHDIAVVSQADVLHRDLPLHWALRYTAQLRLPRDTRHEEILAAVEHALHTTGLWDHRWTRIRDLSGGQTRRTSLALEMLAHPSLLFLDEVTSGLDEQVDRDMMTLFRQLADQGQTVICITHNVNHIAENCHQLAVLAEGGRLAYFGPPEAAADYFQVKHLADIYAALSRRAAAEWQQRFRESAEYADRVTSRLSPVHEVNAPHGSARVSAAEHPGKRLRHQFGILLAREARLARSDVSGLLVLLGQCLLVVVLTILAFGRLSAAGPPPDWNLARQADSMIFLLAMSCFWFGCTNSSKVLVSERGIFVKEQRVGLSVPAYYLAKAAFPICYSALQSALLYFSVALWCDLPGRGPWQATWMVATSIVGVTLGLLISAVAKNESLAVALVPMAMIPQIILSDAVQSLTGWAKKSAEWGIALYWANGALRSTFPAPRHPLLPSGVSMTTAAVVLGLHVILSVVLTLVCLSPWGQHLRQRLTGRRDSA